MISSITQALLKIKIQSNMREQEKKRQRVYDLTPEPSPNFFVYCILSKEKKILKKRFLRKMGSGWLKKNEKEDFFHSSRYVDEEGYHKVNKQAR